MNNSLLPRDRFQLATLCPRTDMRFLPISAVALHLTVVCDDKSVTRHIPRRQRGKGCWLVFDVFILLFFSLISISLNVEFSLSVELRGRQKQTNINNSFSNR